jgi:phage terminase large subunit-like protein
VKLACQRHFDDVERSKSADFIFTTNPEWAEHVCQFIEAMPHVKGRWARRREHIKLEPWQCFNTCSIFGWVEKADRTRYRFTEANIFIARKNAKSTWAAAVANFKFAADREYGAEVYSGATSEKQAWEVFRPAKLMAQRTPDFLKAFGVSVHAKSLTIAANGSRFEPVIGKPGDGASPSCAVVDEYHEHATSDLYDTMETGMGARENPLLLVITTAGSDRSGPCYQLQKDLEKVLEGRIRNDRLFGIVYTADKEDDWKLEVAIIKANPNLGVSVDRERLLDAQRAAIQSARKQNVFKTKHLNIWVNADVSWMNMAKWDAMADVTLKLDDFKGEDVMDGLDLASRIDIASKARIFRRTMEGKHHYYAFLAHYLNEAAVEEDRGQHYQQWANDGRLIVTPGNVTDYNWIIEGVVEDSKLFHVIEVPHDPYQSLPLLQTIQSRADWDQSILPVAIKQTVENMSGPMKELEALVYDGRFHHDGDPVLGWMISNVVCHRDAKDNIFPRKEREENKIDGVIAILVALKRWMEQPEHSGVGVTVF